MPTLAKLTRPKTHRVLRRERLFSALDEARQRPLVWVSGPPGAGKSTLIATYVETKKVRTAWYHLDAGDDDVGTFFYYLGQSLPSASKSVPLPQLTPEGRTDLRGFTRHFFRQYFARPTTLVLDNYHELSEHSPVHEALDYAVAEVPDRCNILVISRSAPPPRFTRHKVAEKLATIEPDALRVSLDETRGIAALRHQLDEAAIARIYELSRGWAAGLALALQREQQVREGCAIAGTSEPANELFEFFATEVFDSMPPLLQQFLQLSSLLPTMTATMAQQLTDRADAETMLEALYRRGLFTDRRATEPPTYQYHDLFRAFLVRRLELATAPEALSAQMRKAGALLQSAGQFDHAIRLFLRAHDWSAARMTILANARELVAQGRSASLREWIDTVPKEIVERDPGLSFWSGMGNLRTDPVAARVALTTAFDLFAAADDVDGQTLACAAVIHSHMYEFVDLRAIDPHIDVLSGLLDRGPRFRTPASELQVVTALLLALSFRRPLRERLDRCVSRVLELLGNDVPDADAASACGALLLHFFSTGDTVLGERTVTHLRALLDRGRVPPPIHALGLIQIGRLCYEKGDHVAGEQAFEQALALVDAHAITLPAATVYSHLGLALCALERDDLASAESHRQQLDKWWIPQRRVDEFVSTRLLLGLACRRGLWESALDISYRQMECGRACGIFWFEFEASLQCAMVCAELDRPAAFAAALAPARPVLVGTGYEHFNSQVDLVEAYYALLKNDRETCHEKLRSGLTSGRQDRGKRTLRLHFTMLSRLYAEALDAGIEVDYAKESIRALHLRPPTPDVKGWPWPLRVYTLGRFEVLRDDRPLEYSRKAPRKTIALLKAIIAFGGTNVREQRLVDAFWADEEGDVAERSMGAALHRLRRLLGDGDAIVQQGGALSLDRSRVWVDIWAFDNLLARPAADATELLNLYRGSFLAEDDGESWPVTMRERLRGRFIHAIADVGQRLEGAQRAEAAIECYLRGLDADPVVEHFYQGLMRCYARLDRVSEALSAYERLQRKLSISLGLKPSPHTERLYQTLKKQAVNG